MAVTLGASGFVVGLALVLVLAAGAKLIGPTAGRGMQRALVSVEVTVAAVALLAPTGVGAGLEAALFTAFAAQHVRAWRSGAADCECFGQAAGASGARAVGLTATSGALAAVAALSGPPSLLALAARHPARAIVVTVAAAIGAVAWRAAFRTRTARAGSSRLTAISEVLVTESAWFLERRISRRSALMRLAVAGSALCVAPLRYLLYPGTALAQIVPGDCGGGLCTDGFTAFCCEINHGLNACPTGTFPGGWWQCQDYSGQRLCSDTGVRYYVDCNALPGTLFEGGCHCEGNDCDYRRVACNIFRYGQCNTQVGGTTAVVCRMVVCENPSLIPGLHCSSSLAVDNSVCGQDVPCLEPPAVELAGAGGV
jgi:hypothetical protein